MVLLAASSMMSLVVAGVGMVLGVLLVGWGLAGRALRLKRERAATAGRAEAAASDEPRMRALEARVSRLEGLVERMRGEMAEVKAGREAARDREAREARDEEPRVIRAAPVSRASRGAAPAAASPEPKLPRGELAADQEFAEVFALADRGLGAAEIAERLQRPTGQVELILNLRRHGIGA